MIGAVNVGFYDKLKLWPETWAAGTAYTLGDLVKATAYNSHSYLCSVAGTSHGTTEPTWPTTNETTKIDGTVTWICKDPKTYNVKSPQGSTVPYVTFALETNVPMATFADQAAIESLTFWVNAFSAKSSADVCEMGDEILAALDNVTLTVTGYTGMKCMREFIGAVRWDQETGIYQLPCRYRVWIDKN